MRIYLDDDSAASLLIRLLQQAGHDSATPTDVGLAGEDDAVRLTEAVKDDRVLLTGNYRDFLNLHNLIMQARGHHPGILVVRRDNETRSHAVRDSAVDPQSSGVKRCPRRRFHHPQSLALKTIPAIELLERFDAQTMNEAQTSGASKHPARS
jgi:hypothetical protein